jgi:protein gp37
VGDKTGIAWTDATWNPIRGCSRVSEGCRHCYAEQQAARIIRMANGKPTKYDGLVKLVNGEARWTGLVRLDESDLFWPLRKREPLRIFVNSMSDLFHETLPDDAIDQVFAVMALCCRHTYQILTKRADRMHAYLTAPGRHDAWSKYIAKFASKAGVPISGVADGWWPRHSQHIWLGVSIENQDAANTRIPLLLRTPAAVRFLSCEPLIGEVVLNDHWISPTGFDPVVGDDVTVVQPRISWVITGCESGPGARPCNIEWLRSLRDQCTDVGVPLFVKQLFRNGKLRRDKAEFPDDLQFMEFPPCQ